MLSDFLIDRDIASILLATSKLHRKFCSDLLALSRNTSGLTTTGVESGICGRILAARKLITWWKRLRILNWMNSVAACAHSKHMQTHLTVTNFLPWIRYLRTLNADIYIPSSLWKKYEVTCSKCHSHQIEAIHFHYLASSTKSIPYLTVGCAACIARDIREWFPWGHISYVSTLGNSCLLNYMDDID